MPGQFEDHLADVQMERETLGGRPLSPEAAAAMYSADGQLDMPTDAPAMFATDETLDRRIRQLENGLADFRARLPAMLREIEALKDLAHPERHR